MKLLAILLLLLTVLSAASVLDIESKGGASSIASDNIEIANEIPTPSDSIVNTTSIEAVSLLTARARIAGQLSYFMIVVLPFSIFIILAYLLILVIIRDNI